MKILGTGFSGMIGSRLITLMPDWEFENLSLETGVDISNKDTVDSFVARSKADWVLHFAAYTDVEGAEKDRDKKEKSIAWTVNVNSTEYFADACKKYKKHLLYVSTDYVFDGTKESYTEEDIPNPAGWYARTKYEGEKHVAKLGDNGLIIRLANPYRANPEPKLDFVHRIVVKLSSDQKITAPTDQTFVTTFIDDIAQALRALVSNGASGIYHVVGAPALSPYEAALEIAQVFGFPVSLVTSTTFAAFFADRAPRPYHAHLKNDKITKLGVRMKSFSEGLRTVKEQEDKKI